MSSFSCQVVEFDLIPHPNADRLSIATIKGTGWQAVVNTDGWLNKNDVYDNRWGVYIPIGAIAAKDHPLLGFLEGKKVRTCKLRKVISQGILLPLVEVVAAYSFSFKNYPKLGDDVSEIIEVKKWQPPVNFGLGKVHVARELTEGFYKYTDIEHLKNYNSVIALGEQVCITEKLHGTSARYGLIGEKYTVGTRNTELDPVSDDQNVWLNISRKYEFELIVRQLALAYGSEETIIYGEIVGPKVQDLTYGLSEPDFFVYDISINGKYLEPKERFETTKSLNLKCVPLLYMGVLDDESFKLVDGKDTLSNTHYREGVVIEPMTAKFDIELGRVKLKLISENFYMRQNATDFEG